MGAVGALAPTVFESVGASTHGSWHVSIIFHKKMCEKCYEFSNSMAKRSIKPPQFGIPNGYLVILKN